MSFYERYAELMKEKGIKPNSSDAEKLMGVSRTTICKWGKSGITPSGKVVAHAADLFGVSADYLLERTDDRTDYTKTEMPRKTEQPLEFPRDTRIQDLCDQLDQEDRIRVEGVIQGMLMSDKYLPNAAHKRTDKKVTSEMIKHDENIMNDDDF